MGGLVTESAGLCCVLPACDPEASSTCPLAESPSADVQYVARTEMNVIYFDHTIDILELNLFTSANQMKSKGLLDRNGKQVDLCLRTCLWVGPW